MKHFFKISQTFTEVTPESAEYGDFSDGGYEMEEQDDYTVKDILRLVRAQGCEEISAHGNTLTIYGFWSTECYQTATEKQLCVHIKGTERNLVRLKNIIGAK